MAIDGISANDPLSLGVRSGAANEALGKDAFMTLLGVARALNQPTWRCEHDGPVSCDGEESPARTLFVQSFALGWAF